jgi:hypothetical protein
MKTVFWSLSVLTLAVGLGWRIQAQTNIGVTPSWLRFLSSGYEGEGHHSCFSGNCSLTDEVWVSTFTVAAGATAYSGTGLGPTIIRSTGTCTIAGTLGNGPNTLGGAGIYPYGDFGGGGGGSGAGLIAVGHTGASSIGNGGVPIVNGGSPGVPPGGSGGIGQTPNTHQYHVLLSTGGYWPGGGSAGAPGGGPAGGLGGHGGGAIILVCNVINFTGTIDVSGGAGHPPGADNSGAGGGGGGGYVILSANNYTANTGVIHVAGGPGGSCNGHAGCGAGAPGGNGWSMAIAIH